MPMARSLIFQETRRKLLLLGLTLAQVVRNDLAGSGLFRMISPDAFVEKNLDIAVLPTFGDWKVINADSLLVGKTIITPTGSMATQFRLVRRLYW